MILNDLSITPPSWLPNNTHYLTIMGSFAYGVTSDSSDTDVYGFCLPPKDLVFPHLRGEIPNFGTQKQNFLQWVEHHIKKDNKSYDLTVYSLVRFFDLCMGCNPNMIDSLFTPNHCVLHITPMGQMVRDSRKLFLSSKCWHTFKGYAWSQLQKISRVPTGKRTEIVEKFGFDCKFAYHIFRLLDECEQLLSTGDLELGRNREELKAIRNGQWTLDYVKEQFNARLSSMESLYGKSVLPYKPNEDAIKQLLVDCMESHYGSLDQAIKTVDPRDRAIRDIEESLARMNRELSGDGKFVVEDKKTSEV